MGIWLKSGEREIMGNNFSALKFWIEASMQAICMVIWERFGKNGAELKNANERIVRNEELMQAMKKEIDELKRKKSDTKKPQPRKKKQEGNLRISAARRLLNTYEREASPQVPDENENKGDLKVVKASVLLKNLIIPGVKQTFQFTVGQEKKLECSGWTLYFTEDKCKPRHYFLELRKKGKSTPKFNAILREVGKKTKYERPLKSDDSMDTKAQFIEFNMFYETVEIELEIIHEKEDLVDIDCSNACAYARRVNEFFIYYYMIKNYYFYPH